MAIARIVLIGVSCVLLAAVAVLLAVGDFAGASVPIVLLFVCRHAYKATIAEGA